MSELQRTAAQLGKLAESALTAIPHMQLPDSGLFSQKTWIENGDYRNGAANVHYSAVTLAGLFSQTRQSPDSVIDVGRAVDAAVEAAVERGVAEELAHMVWVCSMAEDRRARELLELILDVDPRDYSTGEIGEVLFGLVVGARRFAELRDRAHRAAADVAAELVRRFCPRSQVFRTALTRRRIPRRELLEFGLSSFASQVYPLHGLAAYYAFTEEEPDQAVACVAKRIVDVQGPLGQWWWIYSGRAEVVLEGYPVYSVHQDGMAFLGLVGLEQLGLDGFDEPLARGLDWIFGANELGVNMWDSESGLIHRCIQRQGSDCDGPYGVPRSTLGKIFRRSLAPRLAHDRTGAVPERLEVLRECRSYHLGWLLCADSLIQQRVERRAGSRA